MALPHPLFVNLWYASGRKRWVQGEPGDMVLFTRAEDENVVVGFGMIHSRMLTRASRTWRDFGQRNGAETYSLLKQQIGAQRAVEGHEDPIIGNTIMINPVFFPGGFASRIPSKYLLLASAGGLDEIKAPGLIESLRLNVAKASGLDEMQRGSLHDTDGAESIASLATLVEANTWDAYKRRCAITSWKAGVTLRVVYIRPPEQGGQLDVSNTMLLRSELTDLYIDHLIAFDQNGTLVVHADLARQDARAYRELAGRLLRPPKREQDRPSISDIEWRLNGPFKHRT